MRDTPEGFIPSYLVELPVEEQSLVVKQVSDFVNKCGYARTMDDLLWQSQFLAYQQALPEHLQKVFLEAYVDPLMGLNRVPPTSVKLSHGKSKRLNLHRLIENWLDGLTTKQVLLLSFVVFAPVAVPIFLFSYCTGFVEGFAKAVKARQFDKDYLLAVRRKVMDEGFNPNLYVEPFLREKD